MIEYVLTFLGIYFLSLFKFIAGPVLGYAAGYSILEIELVTVSGMMTSVFVTTFLGDWVKKMLNVETRRKKSKRIFTKRTRSIIKVWQKFGVWGIAGLTPLILTPIGGTAILTSFGIKKQKIVISMFLSAVIWAFIFGSTVEYLLSVPLLERFLKQ